MTDILAVELEKLRVYRQTPIHMSDEERMEFIRWNILGCINELNEALEEVGWKPWATSRHLNRDAFLHELVDAQLFLHNLMLAVIGPHPLTGSVLDLQDEVDRLVLERIQRAISRQLDGYDGVTGKCPTCHRSLDDVPPTQVDGSTFCAGCGARIEEVPA